MCNAIVTASPTGYGSNPVLDSREPLLGVPIGLPAQADCRLHNGRLNAMRNSVAGKAGGRIGLTTACRPGRSSEVYH